MTCLVFLLMADECVFVLPGRRPAAVRPGRLGGGRLHDGRARRRHQAALGGPGSPGLLQPLARISAQRLGGIVSHTNAHKQMGGLIIGWFTRSVSHSQRGRRDPLGLCEIAGVWVQTNRKGASAAEQTLKRSRSICLDFYSVNIYLPLSS